MASASNLILIFFIFIGLLGLYGVSSAATPEIQSTVSQVTRPFPSYKCGVLFGIPIGCDAVSQLAGSALVWIGELLFKIGAFLALIFQFSQLGNITTGVPFAGIILLSFSFILFLDLYRIVIRGGGGGGI